MQLKVDYLIIGQGLAGTLLTHFALQKGKTVLVLNEVDKHTPSQIASGVMNPITGRRYVKSWKYEELYPFALATYQALSEQFNRPFFKPQNILRSLLTVKDENDFWARSSDIGYQQYMKSDPDTGIYPSFTKAVQGFGELHQSGRIEIPLLIQTYRNYLLEQNLLIETTVNLADLDVQEDCVKYKDIVAEKVIFCEGSKAVNNPYFSYLPYNFAKGEVIIVKIPGFEATKILKNRLFLIPIEKDIYWIGATYDNDFDHAKPTESGLAYLEKRLATIITVPYTILEHHAAVRPTTKDRRPFLGQHSTFKNLFIFNGLGAKGASLAPYFTHQMVNYLEGEAELNPEVNITRYHT